MSKIIDGKEYDKLIHQHNNQNMSEIEFRIAEILGRSAIENDMEVPKDVQQLAQATRYLATQLRIICKIEIGNEKMADVILKQAIDILK